MQKLYPPIGFKIAFVLVAIGSFLLALLQSTDPERTYIPTASIALLVPTGYVLIGMAYQLVLLLNKSSIDLFAALHERKNFARGLLVLGVISLGGIICLVGMSAITLINSHTPTWDAVVHTGVSVLSVGFFSLLTLPKSQSE